MKHRLPYLILAFLMLLPLLSSCSAGSMLMKLEEGERADMLFDITNSVYTDSYLVRLESNISGILDNMKIELNVTRDSYYIDMLSDSPTVHFETNAKSEVFFSDTSATSQMRLRSGYRDGKMYIQNAVSSSLYSYVTAEEYLEHIYEGSQTLNESLTLAHKSAAKKSCVRLNDGRFLASFTDFPEDELALLISAYFDSTVLTLDKASLTGLTVEIEATKKLELIEMRFILHYDGEASATSTLKILEADLNSLPKIDLYKFREVGDLRVIDMVKNKLAEKINSGSGSLTMTDKVTVNNRGNSNLKNVESTIDYSNADSVFTFDYSYENAAVPGAVSKLRYRDGKMYSVNGDTETVFNSSMSELEARSYIFALVDKGDLMNALISDYEIDKNDPNKYIFRIESPSITEYYYLIGYYPLDSITSSATLTVTLKEGEIAEYTYNLAIYANYNNYRVRINQSNTRIFN